MSKKHPADADPTHKPQSERAKAGSRAARTDKDPAVGPLPEVEGETVEVGRPPESPEMDLELEQLRAELEDAKDRALRMQAELENYRKRVARQMDDERRYANLPLIRDLLPVLDNVGRAIEAAEKTHQTASLLEGFKIVAGQLESVLKRHDCSRIDAVGEPFDPNLHEAVFQQPTGEHPANTVLQETQTGFRLHDRVVRPSQVIVSAPPPDAAAAREDEQTEDEGPAKGQPAGQKSSEK